MTKHARNPILLLEDERATGALIVQLLAGARIANPVEWLGTGTEAIDYLDRAEAGAVSLPVLCVLDLSLPDVIRELDLGYQLLPLELG